MEPKWRLEASLEGKMEFKWRSEASLKAKLASKWRLEARLEAQVEPKRRSSCILILWSRHADVRAECEREGMIYMSTHIYYMIDI